MNLVTGIAEALRRLQRVDIREARVAALDTASSRLEESVRQSLSHVPGEDHSAPWLRTGELRNSITRSMTDDTAVIGSDDPVAVYQELGTATIPPRPFLATTAASESVGLVQTIAETIAAALEVAR